MLANAGVGEDSELAKLIVNMVKEVILGIGGGCFSDDDNDKKDRRCDDVLDLFLQSWIEVRLKVAEGQHVSSSPMSLTTFLGITEHDFSNALSRKVDKALIDLKIST
eukprot:gene34395-44432_t